MDEKLGFRLVKEKIISESQLRTALDYQRAVGGRIDEVLVRLQFVDPVLLRRCLEKLGVPPAIGSDVPAEPPLPREAAPAQRQRPDQPGDLLAGLEALEQAERARKALEACQDAPVAPPNSPPPEPAPVAPANDETAGEEPREDQNALILEALLRILIRKGLISSDEMKEELQNMELSHA